MFCQQVREELELKAAYASLESGCLIATRQIAEMVEGLEPSSAYAQEMIKLAHVVQLNLLQEANRMDHSKKRFKRMVSSKTHKDFEAKRLMKLGRPAADLEPVYLDIEARLSEGLQHLGAVAAQDEQRVSTVLREQMVDKLKAQSDYSERVAKLRAVYDSNLSLAITEAANKRLAVEAELTAAGAPSDRLTKDLLAVSQDLAAQLADLEVGYFDGLQAAFEDAMARKNSAETVEDELRNLQQSLQQKAEALENACDAMKIQRFEALVESQLSRRTDSKAMKTELHRELVGMEKQLQHKKIQQSKFLKEKLDKRKVERVKDLISSGVDPSKAEQQAEIERKQDEVVQDKEISKSLEDEAARLRTALELNSSLSINKIKADHDAGMVALENGLAVDRTRQLTKLKNRLNERKQKRMQELINAGMGTQEAQAVATRECKEAESLGVEMLKNDEARRNAVKADVEADASGWRDAYFKALTNLDDGLAADHTAKHNAMEARLQKKHADRVKVLVETMNMTPEAAAEQATAELASERQAEVAKLEAEAQAARSVPKSKLDKQLSTDMAGVREKYEKNIGKLESELLSEREAERRKLEKRLIAKRAARKNELIKGGMSPDEAEAQAKVEMSPVEGQIHLLDILIEAAKENVAEGKGFKAVDKATDEFNDENRHIREMHEKSVVVLENRLAAEKKAKHDALAARLAKHKQARVEELVASGSCTPEQALAVATAEIATEEAAALIELENEHRAELRQAKDNLDSQLETDLTSLKSKYQQSLDRAEDDLLSHKEAERHALEKRLAEKRAARQQELMDSGMSSLEAEEEAAKELLPGEQKQLKEMDAEMEAAKKVFELKNRDMNTVAAISHEFDEDNKRIREMHEKAVAALDARYAADKKAKHDALEERLQKKHAEHVKELIETKHLSPAEAETQAAVESAKERLTEEKKLDDEMKVAKLLGQGDLDEKLDADLSVLKDRYIQSVAILEDGIEAHKEAEHRKLTKKLAEKRAARKAELVATGLRPEGAEAVANQELKAEEVHALQMREAAIDLARQAVLDTVQSDYARRMREKHAEFEIKMNGCEAALNNKKAQEAKHLTERLARKRNHREQELLLAGRDSVEAKAQAAAEFGDDQIAKSVQALDEKYANEIASLLKAKQDSLARADALSAARDVQLAGEEDMETKQVTADVYKREQSLVDSGAQAATDTMEAAVTASRQAQDHTAEELRALRERNDTELQKLKGEMQHKKDQEVKHLQDRLKDRRREKAAEIAAEEGIHAAAAEAKALEQLAAVEAAEQAALQAQLKQEEERAVQQKQREQVEAEMQLIEQEHKKVAEAAAKAAASRESAQAKLDLMKKHQEEEAAHLKSQMLAHRQSQESALKNRLAEKRELKLRAMANEKASEQARLEEAERLQQEEYERTTEAQRRAAAEEAAAKEALRVAQEAELAAALEAVKAAEIEAAAAAAKEAALGAVREIKARTEKELETKELQRMKDIHSKQEEKLFEVNLSCSCGDLVKLIRELRLSGHQNCEHVMSLSCM